VKHRLAKRLVLYSVIGTMTAMVFMAFSILYPQPLVLVLAMSVGQGIALLALVVYLLAVALDLQSSAGAYIADEGGGMPPEGPSEPPVETGAASS
jgi:hypothetical protein